MYSYSASEKRYNKAMATGYIVYYEVKQKFYKCTCKSMILDSMYINYTNMPEKERAKAQLNLTHAMREYSLTNIQDLQAQVSIRKTGDSVKIVFNTMGYGKIVANINKWGDINIAA